MFNSYLSENPTFLEVLLYLFISISMGVLFSFIYTKVKKIEGYHKDMPIAFILLPTIITSLSLATITITNLLTESASATTYERIGVAIIAALLVVRFRSELRDFEDLSYVFAFSAIGIVLGFGYILFAIVLYLALLLIVVLTYLFEFPKKDSKRINIKITVPEDLNYEDAFTEVFDKYCLKYVLTKSKTSDLGTLFVINYEAILKKEYSQKELIDEIRIRNGNLNVVVTVKGYDD